MMIPCDAGMIGENSQNSAFALPHNPRPDGTARVVVIGLGYVGLPLALALSAHYECWGIDINASRIAELRAAHDRTGAADCTQLETSSLRLLDQPGACPPADIYIVAVPTPVDAAKQPDLSPVLAATRMVAGMLDRSRAPIVVYESTVYPGVTEAFCGPELERVSGLACGQDFFLGYSPERINPGDREHGLDRITKVVAGQTPAVVERLAGLYGAVTAAGVFRAASIKVAEAAKVIENAQRDVNIAFMNEAAQIFSGLGFSIWDVLAVMQAKWNCLPFTPGLVGGHCIGVDPYYLVHCAEQLGCDPRITLAGRGVNEGMSAWLAKTLHQQLGGKIGRVLVMGMTYKEDVPDTRNSKTADLATRLEAFGHGVTVHDPHAAAQEVVRDYGLNLDEGALDRTYDLVVLAVRHQAYISLGVDRVLALVAPDGVFADLKNAFPDARARGTATVWTL